MSVGHSVKEWRKAHNITQLRVAEELGLSERTVQRWELDADSQGPSMLQCRQLEGKWPGLVEALLGQVDAEQAGS